VNLLEILLKYLSIIKINQTQKDQEAAQSAAS
jgi:hypothetical protein